MPRTLWLTPEHQHRKPLCLCLILKRAGLESELSIGGNTTVLKERLDFLLPSK